VVLKAKEIRIMESRIEEIFIKLDKRLRNIGIALIFISCLILGMWLYLYLIFPEFKFLILLSLGVGLLIGGILIVTRIQYAIWIRERAKHRNDKNN